MKLILIIIAAAVIAASLYADYRWRRWLNTRRNPDDPTHRN